MYSRGFFSAGHTFGGFGPTRLINFGGCIFRESLHQKSNVSSFFRAETLRYMCKNLKSTVYTGLYLAGFIQDNIFNDNN